MKVVQNIKACITEQRSAPAEAGRAATRRRRREAGSPEKCSDGYKILTQGRSQQAQQYS
jgi:hypothetical protein